MDVPPEVQIRMLRRKKLGGACLDLNKVKLGSVWLHAHKIYTLAAAVAMPLVTSGLAEIVTYNAATGEYLSTRELLEKSTRGLRRF